LGTLAALWLYNNFVGWLTFLSAAIPPIGGVIIADFMARTTRYTTYPRSDFKRINWAAIIAVALGVACGHWIPGIVPLNAVIGAFVGYLMINPLFSKEINHADN